MEEENIVPYLVKVKDQVKLTHVVKEFVQNLWKEGKSARETEMECSLISEHQTVLLTQTQHNLLSLQ